MKNFWNVIVIILLIFVILLWAIDTTADAQELLNPFDIMIEDPQVIVPGVQITGFNIEEDYTENINELLNGKDISEEHIMLLGSIYEAQRNAKIVYLNLSYEQTTYFRDSNTLEEVKQKMYPKSKYSEEDLDLLSRLVYAETGCSWYPDWVQQATASVVLNRISDPDYPDTLKEVIYQPGQYGPAITGAINTVVPTEKVRKNVQYVLENGSTLPKNIVGQSNEIQGGGVYAYYYDSVLDSFTYFCYK